jgi:hypothetical protein
LYSAEDSALVTFDVRNSLLVTESLGRMHRKRELLKTALRWEGEQNLYAGPGAPTLVHGERPEDRTSGLAAWNALWGREEKGSRQADAVRFGWQDDDAAGGTPAPGELLDPLRWKPLPAGAGHAVAAGGKDAGADVSRVAPLSP